MKDDELDLERKAIDEYILFILLCEFRHIH